MKIENTTPEPAFRPVVLKLTIETKEELEMLERFLGYDQSVPRYVYGIDGCDATDFGKQQQLSTFMSLLWRMLQPK